MSNHFTSFQKSQMREKEEESQEALRDLEKVKVLYSSVIFLKFHLYRVFFFIIMILASTLGVQIIGSVRLKKVTDFPWEPANWNTTRFWKSPGILSNQMTLEKNAAEKLDCTWTHGRKRSHHSSFCFCFPKLCSIKSKRILSNFVGQSCYIAI